MGELRDSDKTFLTDKEAAEVLRISRKTLWRERRAGRITYVRLGQKVYYPKQSIDEYLKHNTFAAAASAA